MTEQKNDDTGSFKIPRKLTGWLSSIVALSLIPGAGTIGVAKSLGSLSDKLDGVISRLDKLEGAGIQAKVDDHEKRLRASEEELAALRVLVQARGGR